MTLFPLPTSEEPETLSADRRRTRSQKALIAAGRNPATLLPLLQESDETCGSCGHLKTIDWRTGKRFFKCDLMPDTRGPGTDVRKWWPACTAWSYGPDETRGGLISELIGS